MPFEYEAVRKILTHYGSLGKSSDWMEFTPKSEGICEVALISGASGEGTTNGISFHRPAASDVLRDIVFELLGISGTCFFEVDVSYVAARSDVAQHLPPELIECCEENMVTIVSSAEEMPF